MSDTRPSRPRVPHPRVVVTRDLPDLVTRRMAALFDTDLNPSDIKRTREQLAAAVAD